MEVNGRLHHVKVIGAAVPAAAVGAAAAEARRPPRRERRSGGGAGGGATEDLVSPIQGTVLKVAVEKGQEVEEGALVCVIEAMKMENEITAHRSGQVTELTSPKAARLPPVPGWPGSCSDVRSRGVALARSGADRPELPLPPGKMPARRGGRWRKRWRYVGAFGDEILMRAARVRVGPLGQTFWAICERETGKLWEGTRTLPPGARGEAWTEHIGGEEEVVPEMGDLGILDFAPDEASPARIEASQHHVGDVRAFLTFRGGRWVESVCPTDEGQYVWTRKRCDVPVECDVRVGGRRWRFEGRGVEDESAGYHPHHTVWSWSAGVGRTRDGRSVGWNLVSGINDPPARSERAIWVDGEPSDAGPVSFEEALDAITFDDSSRLEFSAEAERSKEQNMLVARYVYRQPFGSFRGTLPGGLEPRARHGRDGVPRRRLVSQPG